MALVLKDRVRESTNTAGTGTLTLGGAVGGFQGFSVIGDGNTTYYAIVDVTTGAWEVGVGSYTLSGQTLSRDTVLESSSGGTLVNFTSNIKDVFCTYPAEQSVTLNDVQTLTNKTINLTNNTLVATSAQLAAALTDETGTGSVVFSASPALTGTPTAPTAAAGTNTTQIASTAHVFAERANTATLTNKTISGSNNTLSNIGNASLTNSSITFGSTAQALGSTVSALNGVSIGDTTASTGAFTNLAYTGTLTGGTGVINIGSGQLVKDAAGNLGLGVTPEHRLDVEGGIRSTGLNAVGTGGFFNGANKFGVDNNDGTTRFYSSGPNSSTRGSYDFRITDSVGALDVSAMRIDSAGKILAATGGGWVGTVSQSGSSSVIERGSNVNGEFVRFADGTQICTNGNASITTNPAAFVGTVTNIDGSKLRIGHWY